MMMQLHLEKATNVSDLGEIINLEILNWHQLVVLKWDKQLERGLGKPIPRTASLSDVYRGTPLIRVLGSETQINQSLPLELSVIALGTGDAPPLLKVRPLGSRAWQEVRVNHVRVNNVRLKRTDDADQSRQGSHAGSATRHVQRVKTHTRALELPGPLRGKQ